VSSDPPLEDVDTDSDSTGRPRRLDRVPLVVGLTVVAHSDRERIGERAPLAALESGRGVVLSRLEPLFSPPRGGPQRPLAEVHVSRSPLVIEPLGRGVRLDASRCPKPVSVDGVALSGSLGLPAERLDQGVVLVLGRRVALLLHRIDPLAGQEVQDCGLVGASAALAALHREIARLAPGAVPVLVRGETGSGKELVARALHLLGPRRQRPYLAVNLAALPPSLAAAELFGAARGAYTGADHARPGLFTRAERGTLFLDEVAEAPLDVQALLLRALETGEIQPVGGEPVRTVDVRVVAATDADLEAAVAAGRFRAPLLHRLEGYVVRVPPLRERRDDVPRLLRHFFDQELRALGARREPPWPSADQIVRMLTAPWPGNVRQLRNVARRLAVGSEIPALANAPLPETEAPKDDQILDALRRHDYRVQSAAHELGLPRTSVYERLARITGRRSPAALARGDVESALSAAGGDVREAAARLEVSLPALRRRLGQLGLRP
jgi:two-component system nitrogen regulation response regulator GlnG